MCLRQGVGVGREAGSLCPVAFEAPDPPAGNFRGFLMPSLGERLHLCITASIPSTSIGRAVRKCLRPTIRPHTGHPWLREMEIPSVLRALSQRPPLHLGVGPTEAPGVGG